MQADSGLTFPNSRETHWIFLKVELLISPHMEPPNSLPGASGSAAVVTMSYSEQTRWRHYAHTEQAAKGEYSKEEELYFAHYIVNNKQCKEFVNNHPISCSAKQVWNKLENSSLSTENGYYS